MHSSCFVLYSYSTSPFICSMGSRETKARSFTGGTVRGQGGFGQDSGSCTIRGSQCTCPLICLSPVNSLTRGISRVLPSQSANLYHLYKTTRQKTNKKIAEREDHPQPQYLEPYALNDWKSPSNNEISGSNWCLIWFLCVRTRLSRDPPHCAHRPLGNFFAFAASKHSIPVVVVESPSPLSPVYILVGRGGRLESS